MNEFDQFEYACEYGDLETIQFILQKESLKFTYDRTYIWCVQLACKHGHLDCVKWMLEYKPTNISCANNYAFRMACANGHLTCAKWLYSIITNKNINMEWTFMYACSLGHLHVAQWLLQIYPKLNISYNNNYAFKKSYQNKKFRVVQYLQYLKPFKYCTVPKLTINKKQKENILCILYAFTNKGYKNKINAGLLLSIYERFCHSSISACV